MHPDEHAATSVSPERVQSLESDLSTLQTSVIEISKQVSGLAQGMAQTNAEIRELTRTITQQSQLASDDRKWIHSTVTTLADRQASAQRTNWPVLLSIAGVSVATVSLVGGVLAYSIRAPVEAVNYAQDDRISRVQAQQSVDHDRCVETALITRLLLEGKVQVPQS